MEDEDKIDTSTEDGDSDSTVLLAEYFDEPKKIDAKRRRLSSLHDKIHADKYDDEENTASHGASDDSRANDKHKQKSNVDKNLLITKYLAGLGEVKIENEQQTFPVTTEVTKQIKKVLDSDNGRNSMTNAANTDFDDDIICLDSDDEAQIDDENEKNQNENQNNAGVHKVYGDNNNLTENINNYGKLKVLKPAAINARRATINVFERSVLADNSDDSFRLDKNKTDTIAVMRSSVIIARRATTSFEEDCNTNNERNEAIETNAIDNTNMRNKNITVQSYNTAYTSSAISVDTKNLKSNINKRIRNEDKIPSESKRQRTETMSKCTQHLQLRTNTHNNEIVSRKLPDNPDKKKMDETIDNKENENVNNTHSEQEIIEAHEVPKESWVGYKSKTLGMVDTQELTRLQDKEIRRSVQVEEQASKACDLAGTNKVQDQQKISAILIKPKLSTVPNEQVTNVSHDNVQDNPETNEEEIYRALDKEVINKSHNKPQNLELQDKQEISDKSDEQDISKVGNEQVINKSQQKQNKTEVQGEQETNVVSDEQEISKARNEEVINKSRNKEKSPELQDTQEISVVPGEQEIGIVDNEQVMNESYQKRRKTEIQDVQGMYKARYEEVMNESHDKHKKTKVQSIQGMRTAQDELETCSVRKEEVINESHDKQKKTKLQGKQENTTVQDDHEICKANNQQEINEFHDKQDKYKVQRKQEISTTQDQNVIRETRDKQGTSKIPKDQIINEASYNKKRNVVHDDDISRIHDMQETGDVQDKEVISDDELKADNQVQHLQRTTKAHNQQETRKPHDAQKTNKPINESEKNETNEITLKLCPDREKIHIHKFQVNFFTVVENFIKKKGYLESAMVLHNLIQTLKTHAMNGIVQTDIKYTCPECKHVTTYSASFLNNNDPEENIATADDFQKCRLCQALTKLHISYMKKFLQQVTEGTVQNKVKNNVATSDPPLCNGKSCKRAVNSNRPTTNNPEIIAKVSKEADTEMPLCNETPSQNINVLKEKDTCVQPKPSHAIVETLPKSDPVITKKRVSREYMIDSKRKKLNAAHNDGQHLTDCENTPEKQTNNLQSKITNNNIMLDSGLISKSNLVAVAIAEECIEKENQKSTDHVSEVASEKASSTLTNEDVETYKPSDNVLDSGPSARSENENMETTNSKEHDKANEITLKSLEDTFTKLKHNKNTEKTKNKKAKEQQNTNTVTPGSSNRNNGLDIQPNCNINTRTDVQYNCPSCSCKYVRASKFLRHMSTNHNAKDTTILENWVRRKCAFCNEYLRHENYNKHVKKYHPEKFTENVASNENNNKSNEDGSVIMENDMSNTSDSSRCKYHCSICDEIFCTYYASRQHRKVKHPEFRNQPIYKKVIIKGKDEQEGTHCENEELTAEDNTLNTDSELEDDTDAVASMKNLDRHCSTNYKKVHQTEGNEARFRNNANNMQQARADESGATSAKSVGRNENSNINQVSSDDVTISDTSKYMFHCTVCDEILNNDYASRQHRKQKHPELRHRQIYKKVILKGKEEQDGGDCSSSDESDLDDNEEGASDANDEENEDSDNSEYVDETYNDNSMLSNTKSFKYACALCKESFPTYYIARKHRMEKHPNMGGAHLIIKILDDKKKKTSNEQSSNKNEKNQSPSHDSSSSSDNEEIEDNNDKSVPPRYYEKEGNSGDEAIKASDHSIKKRDYNVKLFGNEKGTSARAKMNEKISTQESRREKNDDQLRAEHKQIENINANCANKFSEIEDAHASDDGSLKISERTAKKKKERISKLFGDDFDNEQPNKTDCDPEITINYTRNTSNLKPTDVVSKTKDVRVSEERENNNEKCGTDTSCRENAEETCINGNDINCKVTEVSELAINGKKKIEKLNNAETKVQDDDRTEIDMIDCFLEELNSEPPETIHTENSGDNNNKNTAVTVSQRSDGEIQNNEEYQYQTANLSFAETCLDNIKITNITSIADKLYIYVCQECFYATDDYDIVIRHCQNHYNNIEDPVIYCQICQINYDVPCFQRHESSHDKYLKGIKIHFSYEWLFANWQRVFENNEMVLTDAEDMQVKSIYKTFCVKMVVEQDGPWQTSLYLCRKCNTCVPPRDIESHVQQTCQFINDNSCNVCNYAFLTDDMRIHHDIYHKDDASKLFKIIVFNDTNDKSFNLKLFEAKLLVNNKGNQRVIDIFKCLCGLCFISLKNFKLHFVECEESKSNGIDCPECTVCRRFLPTELASHRALHHGTANYEFKVQRIGFQEETNNNNNSEAVCNTDAEKENGPIGPPSERGDFEVNDMLKNESLTQISNEGSQRQSESVECTEENLTGKRDISKDELLTQNSNNNDSQGYPENVEINEEDLAVKRDMLKDESLTQISNEDESQKQPEPVECIEQNLTDNRDIAKDELFKQNSNDNDAQGYPENVEINEEDLAVKRDMLKDETLTHITNEDESQKQPEPVECIEQNLTDNRDIAKDELLTQNLNDNDAQGYPENVEINEEDLAVKREMLKDETLTQTTNKDSEQSDSESVRRNEENLAFETDNLDDEKFTQPTNKDVEQRDSAVQLDDENLAVEIHTLNESLRNTDDGYHQSKTDSVEFDEENAVKRDKLKGESIKQANNEGDTELVELSDDEDDVDEKVDGWMDISSKTVIPIDSDSDSDIEFVFSNLEH